MCTCSSTYIQSYQEHSTRSHLNQQLRSYETDNQRLQSQLEGASQRETSLQSQVQGLKAKEKDHCERIHQLETQSSSSGPAPVPKPRTSLITPQLSTLQAEIEKLQTDLDKSRHGATILREKVEKEQDFRKTVEKTLDKKNTEYQELLMKYNTKNPSSQQQDEVEHERLTRELSQLRVTENTTSQSMRQKDQQLQRLMGEANDLRMNVATLEKQRTDELAAARHEAREEALELRRAKSECEGKIANLTEQLRLASPVQTGVKGSMSNSAVARRLNDALGNVKELEAVSC